MKEFIINEYKKRGGAVIPKQIFEKHPYEHYNENQMKELQKELNNFIEKGLIEKNKNFYKLTEEGHKMFGF